jgi:hypothetical protein
MSAQWFAEKPLLARLCARRGFRVKSQLSMLSERFAIYNKLAR